MIKFFWIISLLISLSSCATRSPYADDYCVINDLEKNFICSEKQPDGTFKDVDRSVDEIFTHPNVKIRRGVIVTVESFEQCHAQ